MRTYMCSERCWELVEYVLLDVSIDHSGAVHGVHRVQVRALFFLLWFGVQ